MAPAIVTVTIGGILVYSAVAGVGILDILRGVTGVKINPGGASTPSPTAGSAGAPTGPLATYPDSHAGPNSNGLVYPLPVHGTDLGGVAAHKARPFGNWQSDNAVDIGCPRGTPVRAVDDGIVVRLTGSWDGTGLSNPNGFNVTLMTKNNEWFYTHMEKREPLKVGQHLKAGTVIGLSGAANGVNHLHIASLHGDPEQLLHVK